MNMLFSVEALRVNINAEEARIGDYSSLIVIPGLREEDGNLLVVKHDGTVWGCCNAATGRPFMVVEMEAAGLMPQEFMLHEGTLWTCRNSMSEWFCGE